jgi:hypothetical protein
MRAPILPEKLTHLAGRNQVMYAMKLTGYGSTT